MQKAGLHRRPAYFAYRLFWSALDWLFPPYCAGCNNPGERWCLSCQDQTFVLTPQVCPQCGEPQGGNSLCQICRQDPPAYRAVRSWAVYGGFVRHALHALKYGQNLALGDALSVHLIQVFNQHNWPVDIITPVPLSRKRMRQRGYNQAALLAKPLSLATRIPYIPNVIWRARDTASQVGLNGKERQQNVKGAFEANPKLVLGKSILVVDDITTTGATIQNCATALLAAGAAEVFGLTVARAGLNTHNDSDLNSASVS